MASPVLRQHSAALARILLVFTFWTAALAARPVSREDELDVKVAKAEHGCPEHYDASQFCVASFASKFADYVKQVLELPYISVGHGAGDAAPGELLRPQSGDLQHEGVEGPDFKQQVLGGTQYAPSLGEGQHDRRTIMCYLKGLTQLASVSSVTQPLRSLQSALEAKGIANRSCAVVGSSGILKMHSNGQRIDGSEVVMRFNDAPVHGYETLAGSKDMVRFVNMHFAKEVLRGKATADPEVVYVDVLTSPKSKRDMERLAVLRPELQLFQVPEEQVLNVEEGLRKLFDHSIFKGRRRFPTSGAMGMLLAAGICARIEAFGMAMSRAAIERSAEAGYHYYEAGGAAATNEGHESFAAEKHLWRYLSTDAADVDTSELAVLEIPSECDPPGSA
mmetsp:Transcript_66719/g.159532  ORF Transcript_66719/g.159532 Transcript_66719/m.159532 type:complete len:391 (+) Transcript_66719:108-1280(+)